MSDSNKGNSRQSVTAISVQNIGKCYPIYAKPFDRLKQALWPGKKNFYTEFWALNGISFKINKGETLGIIGSNGSGKSTLLQLICGTVKPTMGELNINGRVSALLELGAGFNPEFSGGDNIFLNAAVMGLSREETEKRYDEIVAFADIGDFIDRPVKTYSSGMYVRLAFAVAVNVSPDILLIDEALSVGDARFQQKCMAKIRKFCESGTVVFVSHDTAAVTELCSRAIWMKSGRVQMDSSPKKVVEKYLQYMYEGEESVQDNDSGISANPTSNNGKFENFVPVDNKKQQFGNKKAVIERVRFISRSQYSSVAYAGEKCEISMIVQTFETIKKPIAGYLVKDPLGREIFGDNSGLMKLEYPEMESGSFYHICFQINEWPNLIEGDYVLSLAVGDGTFEEHDLCHWVYDVLVIKSVAIRPPAGMFSIPNTEMKIVGL